MAELEQLASDALVTPKRVLPGQPQDQLPALGQQLRSTRTGDGGRRRPSDDGPGRGASPGWWPGCTRSRAPADSLWPRAARIRRSPVRQRGRAVVPQRRRSSCRRMRSSIVIGGRAAREDEQVDQQAKEGMEEGQQYGRAE